jgi:hypothetical protein
MFGSHPFDLDGEAEGIDEFEELLNETELSFPEKVG